MSDREFQIFRVTCREVNSTPSCLRFDLLGSLGEPNHFRGLGKLQIHVYHPDPRGVQVDLIIFGGVEDGLEHLARDRRKYLTEGVEALNDLADQRGEELSPAAIFEAFQDEYVRREGPLALVDFQTHPPVAKTGARVTCEADVTWQGKAQKITGHGNGPIDAFVHALRTLPIPKFEVLSYAEHSLGAGAEASAVAYVQIKTVTPQDREITRFGAGIDSSIDLASFKAIVNAVNRSQS